MRDFDPDNRFHRETDSIRTAAFQFYEDGRVYAQAELRRQKLRITETLRLAKGGIIALAAAAVLGLATLITFMVGLVLTLAPLITPIGATVLVTLVGLVVAFLLVRRGMARLGTIGRSQ